MSGNFTIKDCHGNDIHLGHGGDVWFPQFSEIDDYREHMKEIRNLELRDDDVILAGYPRSGTHWHEQILHMLLDNTTDYVGRLEEDLIDWMPPEKMLPPNKPRLLVTHLRLPRQVFEKKLKVIYYYRNPKDAWVSNYNTARDTGIFKPYKGTWPHFFDLMMDIGYWYGDWFDHVLSWEKAASANPDQIFLTSFERMKLFQHSTEQVIKIDQFLGLNRGRELCEQIAEACEFSKLKAARPADGKFWQEGSSGMYRKGEIGDWKNWFTVEQNERFDAVYKKRMADSKLEVIFQ